MYETVVNHKPPLHNMDHFYTELHLCAYLRA